MELMEDNFLFQRLN